jgi:putative ABC transport system permease protein
MSVIFLLARSWASQQRVRTWLVVAAIALAAGLVVFTVSAYRAALERSTGLAANMLGPYELVIMPQIAMQPTISDATVQELMRDPAIAKVVRTQIVYGDIEDAKDTTYYDSWRAAFIATPDGSIPVPIAAGRMPTTRSDGIEGVLSGGLARRWRVNVGDELPMQGPGGEQKLTIVGVTDELLSHNQASGVFITADALRTLTAGTIATDRLYVDVRNASEIPELVKKWKEQLAAATPPALVHDVQDFAAELGTDKIIKNLRMMASGAAVIVLLAALFIVYTAMAAGADERRRQLALLRTIGMTRGQVLLAVLGESLWLALLGCAVGVPCGWILLQGLAIAQPSLFGRWIMPDIHGVIIGLVVICGSVLTAGLLPAYAASRVKPVEAMSLIAEERRSDHFNLRACIGVVTFITAIILFSSSGSGSVAQSVACTVSGFVLLVISLFALVSVIIRVCERIIGPVIARIYALPPGLLQHQSGSHLTRASGMLLTIAVCLGFSVVMNIWGRTMVTPFLPSPELPEQVISILPGGVPPSDAGAVAKIEGFDAQRVLPLIAEQTMLGPTLLAQTGSGLDELYVQFMGVELSALAQGKNPLLPIVNEGGGDFAAQLAALATPGACLVPSSFARRFNLQVGDRFQVHPCNGSNQLVELHIAGFAALPGWQWITKMGRMRTLDGKPMAVLLMSPATAKLLGIESVRHWLADTTPAFDHAKARAALQVLANKHADNFSSAHFGFGEQSKPSVKMIATGEVARRMNERSNEVIWVLGAIPLAGLLVAVLGVANAVAAGIRARRWEFGVLRAIGLERQHAHGLIVAETLIITTAAGVLCVVFGMAAAWAAIDMSLRAFNTGTGAPPLIIPLLDIVIAWTITTVVCVIAAWWPARRLAQATPLALLQAGRAAM